MNSSDDLSDVEMHFESMLEPLESDPDSEVNANFTMAVLKFQHACKQVMLLNNRIRAQQSRYDRAKRDNQRSFRYTIRLRISTLEGVRNVFYEYACKAAEEVEDLQDQVFYLRQMINT